MNTPMLVVFLVLFASIALFITDWLRLDLVALMALLALALSGVLTPKEALAGFSNPLVIIIAGLFVVGAGLLRTGVADLLGTWLARAAGRSRTRLVVVVMVVVALLSAFMSSTGTVAILLPVVITLAHNADLNPSKLLIPLSFASLVGGMLTLIGTPPNIVVSNHLVAQGEPPFGFFAFTPVGLVMLVLAVGFMAALGLRLLPDRPSHNARAGATSEPAATELAASYGLAPASLHRLTIGEASPLVGQTIAEANLRRRYDLNVVELRQPALKRDRRGDVVDPASVLTPGSVLLVNGSEGGLERACTEQRLERLPEEDAEELAAIEATAMAELLLTPRSRLLGHTLAERRFRERRQLMVLSVLRMGRPIGPEAARTRLRFGDTLLVQGTVERIQTLDRHDPDFVVISRARRPAATRLSPKMALALGIMVGMLVLMTFNLLPAVLAVLLAAVAMVLLRCLSTEDAYRSISWESLVLIAGMLPVATALKKTGGMDLVVGLITSSLGSYGPTVMMLALFLLTSLFSQFISNTATTVLVAPIAYQAAASLGVSARPFLMIVAIAASTAFATPIASPVNTLVLTPGGYRFTDYAKTGVGLQLLMMAAAILLVPLVFPL